MDAVDLNWCLACGCRIELDVSSPYCSQSCMNSDNHPSTSTRPSHLTLPSFADRDSVFEDDDYRDDAEDCLPDHRPASPIHNTWIGRGEAGIRAWAQSIPRGAPCNSEDTPSGTLKPKLLLQSRRVKPSLCMSRAQPAPPEPSRPILTPQQSLPSLSRDSTSVPSASMVSLTTGSSSYSVVTPATSSEAGSFHDAPAFHSNTQQHNFLGGLKAQLRAWATSSTPQKEAIRSTTLTRTDTARIVDDSECESVAAFVHRKVRRPQSPTPFYVPEQHLTKRKDTAPRPTMKENAYPVLASGRTTAEEHPAYRTRGRKASRISS